MIARYIATLAQRLYDIHKQLPYIHLACHNIAAINIYKYLALQAEFVRSDVSVGNIHNRIQLTEVNFLSWLFTQT